MNNITDISSINEIYNTFEQSLEIIKNLSSHKTRFFIKKFINSNAKQNACPELSDSLIEEKTRHIKIQLENRFQEKIIFKEKEIYQEISDKLECQVNQKLKSRERELIEEITGKFEKDYEERIRNFKTLQESIFTTKLNNFKNDIEWQYKNTYEEKLVELKKIYEPQLKSEYERKFEEQKNIFVEETKKILSKEYERQKKIAINTAKLEYAVDSAIYIKKFKENFLNESKDKIKEELWNECKSNLLNKALSEIKLERQKFKEQCEAEFESEKKILEMQLREELIRTKQEMKNNADKYIYNQLKKLSVTNS